METKPELDQDAPSWKNGVTLKKTRDGYTWTIAVAAEGNSALELTAAAQKAIDVDKRFSSAYGKQPTSRR